MRSFNVFLVVTLAYIVVTFKDAHGKKMGIEDAKKTVKNLRKTCAGKSGAPADLLDNAANGDFPADRRLQCYQKCMLGMMKAMKDDKIRVSVIVQQSELMLIPQDAERVKNVVQACESAATSSDGCEAAWQFCKCYYEKDPEAYMIV